jgi:hypothetical protein
MHWLYHWVWLDFYVPIWPNIAASILCASWVVVRLRKLRQLHIQHHQELLDAQQTHHEALKKHIETLVGGQGGRKEGGGQ